jgi:hypothetical protein
MTYNREENDRKLRQEVIFSSGTLDELHLQYPDRKYQEAIKEVWVYVGGTRELMETGVRGYVKNFFQCDGMIEARDFNMQELAPGIFLGEIRGKLIRRIK